jgi:ketosteroid isomerase-like protein
VTPDEKADLIRDALERAVMEGGGRSLLGRYDELFTEDFRWRPAIQASIEGNKEYQGREGFARYWDDFEAGFSHVSYRNATFRAVGYDTVLGQLRLCLEGTESGVRLEHDIGWVFRFDGDKIASGETHLTWADAEAAANAQT